MLTPEQQQLFGQTLTTLGPDFLQGMQGFMQPRSEQDMQSVFQKAYVDPAMQAFEQKALPAVQQRFVDVNAGSSSALNQALAQGAADLSTSLGSQYGQLYQNQQQQQLQALGALLPLLTGGTFTPLLQQQQGLAGPLIGAGGGILGGIMSSKEVKENIRDYDTGLEELENFEVKIYDYIKDVGGKKDCVGLIAEELPKEVTAMRDGILCVDLYGLVGVVINAVKELNERVKKLEAE